jgi:hypothetical protein
MTWELLSLPPIISRATRGRSREKTPNTPHPNSPHTATTKPVQTPSYTHDTSEKAPSTHISGCYIVICFPHLRISSFEHLQSTLLICFILSERLRRSPPKSLPRSIWYEGMPFRARDSDGVVELMGGSFEEERDEGSIEDTKTRRRLEMTVQADHCAGGGIQRDEFRDKRQKANIS